MSDLISRCELFNRLATIPAPAEANEFKAKIYEVIQSMETADVAYICDREKCERCDPRCDLTRDKEHAATTEKAVFLDGISRPQGTGRKNHSRNNSFYEHFFHDVVCRLLFDDRREVILL